MASEQAFIWAIDIVSRETMLFAAAGFLFGGIDDLAIDLIYFAWRGRRRMAGGGGRPQTLADFPVERCDGRIAVFVPAWDESAVIGAMLHRRARALSTTPITRSMSAPIRTIARRSTRSPPSHCAMPGSGW